MTTDSKPTVLFLCTHNPGRSQMAVGFFNHLAGDQAVAWSGGSEPGDKIDPAAVKAMAEVGIDIREFPKPWTVRQLLSDLGVATTRQLRCDPPLRRSFRHNG